MNCWALRPNSIVGRKGGKNRAGGCVWLDHQISPCAKLDLQMKLKLLYFGYPFVASSKSIPTTTTNPYDDVSTSESATIKPMQPYNPRKNRLEFAELLDSLAGSGKHSENVESDLLIN